MQSWNNNYIVGAATILGVLISALIKAPLSPTVLQFLDSSTMRLIWFVAIVVLSMFNLTLAIVLAITVANLLNVVNETKIQKTLIADLKQEGFFEGQIRNYYDDGSYVPSPSSGYPYGTVNRYGYGNGYSSNIGYGSTTGDGSINQYNGTMTGYGPPTPANNDYYGSARTYTPQTMSAPERTYAPNAPYGNNRPYSSEPSYVTDSDYVPKQSEGVLYDSQYNYTTNPNQPATNYTGTNVYHSAVNNNYAIGNTSASGNISNIGNTVNTSNTGVYAGSSGVNYR